ncbi:MAG TPA: ABC transporter permease, partial [Trinickia sp.]|uniref:ABC transporter permease n=1 Tax=Trinickia sp. TaxID=2571163 RepID=UPI002C5437C1
MNTRAPLVARFSFSFARWWSIVLKEFLQLRRDRVTFAMIVGVPIIQLTLFGFAINTDPKHLPSAVIVADNSPFVRSFIAAMQHSAYFAVARTLPNEEAGRQALARGEVLFVLTVPVDFSRRLLRGEHPTLLVEADATDPIATGTALGALPGLVQSVVD